MLLVGVACLGRICSADAHDAHDAHDAYDAMMLMMLMMLMILIGVGLSWQDLTS